MKKLVLLFIAVSTLGSAGQASASGFAIPGGPIILDGSVTVAADGATPPSSTTAEAFIRVNLEPGKSYSCTLLADELFADLDFQSISDPSFGNTNNATIGLITPALSEPADRVSIFPTGLGTQVAGDYTIGIDNQTVALIGGAPQTAKGRVDCQETTLYGGYNTNVNDFNFLEVLNITNTTITAAITATNSDGTVVINQQQFVVAPNTRADIDLHTPAGPNKFGLVKLIHNGPYGALQASVSQYDGTISNFVLTSSLPLKPRDK